MKTNSTFKTLAGIVLLSGVLLMAGCSKAKNEQPVSKQVTTNSPYYLTGLLGNESVAISGPSNPFVDTLTIFVDSNGHQYGNPGQGPFPQNFTQITQYITGATWTSTGTSTLSGSAVIKGSIQLKKLSVRVYVAPIHVSPSTTLYTLLTPGNVSLANDNDPNDGAIISVRDNEGVLWTSLGDQTGSTFQILSTGQNMGTYAIITGTVSAKMYNGLGGVKQLTSTAFNAMVGL